jgi:Flp pilus assembly protein TadD
MRPKFPDSRNKLAQSLLQLGDLEGAVRELEMALEGNPMFVPARLNLGLAHLRAGRRESARREWQTCRDHEPNNPQVRAYLALADRHEAPTGG